MGRGCTRVGRHRAVTNVRVGFAHSALCLLIASSVFAAAPVAGQTGGLRDIARRLDRGDTAAIGELLAHTRPAATTAETPEARIDRLRAEIEVLRARRAARPTLFPAAVQAESSTDGAAPAPGSTRVDPLRASRAWLRAGDAARALAALEGDGPDRLHLEARALEAMGRTSEAIALLERLVRETDSPLARIRAEADLEHLKWMEKRRSLRGGRP